MKISPFAYFGGKFFLSNYIYDIMPPHRTFIEIFGGSGVISMNKTPSDYDIFNDLNKDIYNFFMILKEHDTTEELIRILKIYPYSRDWFYYCRDNYCLETDNIKRAAMWFYSMRISFGGMGDVFSFQVNLGTKKLDERYLDIAKNLWLVHNRFKHIFIENQDFRILINRFNNPETLFYLDPPYVHSTRRGNDEYKHEMTDQDHYDLVNMLLPIKAKVILSGYDNEIYQILDDKGWNRMEIMVRVTCSREAMRSEDKEKFLRKEVLWYNFELKEQSLFENVVLDDEQDLFNFKEAL